MTDHYYYYQQSLHFRSYHIKSVSDKNLKAIKNKNLDNLIQDAVKNYKIKMYCKYSDYKHFNFYIKQNLFKKSKFKFLNVLHLCFLEYKTIQKYINTNVKSLCDFSVCYK